LSADPQMIRIDAYRIVAMVIDLFAFRDFFVVC
jgi:hypothetical protein